ncbi:MAG: class I SAM-dependent methyltransferase [Actinomycetota bacterium]
MGSTFTRGISLHARIYDVVCGWEERRGLLAWRKVLVGDLLGDVVEIGAGTGRNFRHYPKDARVIASDYDPVMLERAVERADRAEASVSLLLADAMALPFRDDSVETLVIGLVLCSVPDPVRVVDEAKRVLRPGGRMRFLEHVRDEDGSLRARVQDAVNPAWRAVSGGCNANRRTLDTVTAAGFEVREVSRFKLGLPHIAPHVCAEAVLR